MDQSLYIPMNDKEKEEKIIEEIKNNISDRLVIEMRIIIKKYNKAKNMNKKKYVPPSLTVDFD